MERETFNEVKERLLENGNLDQTHYQASKIKPEEVLKLHVYDYQTKKIENLYLKSTKKSDYDIGSLNNTAN